MGSFDSFGFVGGTSSVAECVNYRTADTNASNSVLDAIARSLATSVDDLYADAGVEPPSKPEPTSARDAIASDQALTGAQRRALLEVYDGFIAANRQR